MYIFTDASVNPQTRQGVGCFALVTELDDPEVVLQHYDWTDTTSTQCELHTIHRLLIEYGQPGIILYTDCARAISLSLASEDYSRQDRHVVLFDDIKALLLKYQVQVVKIKGHMAKRDQLDRPSQIFGLVDRAARRRMRERRDLNSIPTPRK